MRRSASCFVCASLLCTVVAASGACEPRAEPPRKRGPVATLTGHVRLAEGEQLPSYAASDLVHQPWHGAQATGVPQQCVAANARARWPNVLSAGRALSNIVIGASDFTHVHERAPLTHHVAITDCGLTPQMIAAMEGDRVVIENRDAFGFEPLIGPTFAPERLARGEQRVWTLAQGVESIACSPRAPCGRTDLVVFHHPIAAVTDARGAFRIEGFPAREVVRISAWHPLFEDSETFVWLDPSSQTEVDLVLKPKQRFVAPAKADPFQ